MTVATIASSVTTLRSVPRFAAIDVGSNASRLLIVQANNPLRVRTFRSMREPVRMGHGVFLTGELDQAVIDHAVSAMKSFSKAIEEAEVEDYRAIVTASARGAKNADQLLERVRKEAGIELEAVDGIEEARIVGLAVRQVMEPEGRTLLMDLGGGSLELVELDNPTGGVLTSLKVGTVRMLEAFLNRGEPITEPQERLVREYLQRQLAPHRRNLRHRPWDLLIGTGGNFNTIASLCPAEDARPGRKVIDVAKARKLLAELKRIDAEERMRRYDLRADRADVIVPALYVIDEMAEVTDNLRITAPGVGMKEGITTELVAKHYKIWDYSLERDKVLSSALHLGRRYHFDERHATQVASLAIEIFDKTQKLHKLGAEDRGLLRLAALLHDIGDFVNTSAHHKHTQYLIENSDIFSVSVEDRHLMAQVARYHRRALPHVRHAPFRELSDSDRARVRGMAAILRVADALDRSHRSNIDRIEVNLKRDHVNIEAWSESDLSLEQWTVERKADLFREHFGRGVRLQMHEPELDATGFA